MADRAPDQEPSIEEILASIRQIISDDEDKPSPPPPGLAVADDEPFAAPAAAPVNDVLELTDMLPDDEIAAETPAAFADFMANDDAPPEPVIEEPAPEEILPGKPSSPPPEPAPTPRRMEIDMRDMEPIPEDLPAGNESPEAVLTPQAASAALQGFAKLTSHMAVERQGNGVTIEDIVREQLKPMLREWLNGNLPQLIEKLVQKELERLSRRIQD